MSRTSIDSASFLLSPSSSSSSSVSSFFCLVAGPSSSSSMSTSSLTEDSVAPLLQVLWQCWIGHRCNMLSTLFKATPPRQPHPFVFEGVLVSWPARFGNTRMQQPLFWKSANRLATSVKVKLIRWADMTPQDAQFMKHTIMWSSWEVPTSMAFSFNHARKLGIKVLSASAALLAENMVQFSCKKSSTHCQARLWSSCHGLHKQLLYDMPVKSGLDIVRHMYSICSYV